MQDSLSKEEIEKLLRHGAYDIFNEGKNGNWKLESNKFAEDDIDSILARRSTTIIHDSTGTNSNVQGGTFSKATFKGSGNAAMGADITGVEIDISDPDFWSKVVGKGLADEALTKEKSNFDGDSSGSESSVDDKAQESDSSYDH
mmetsp:Transcript_27513/g.40650  ORF Transcript_27513/g.40650 Transcript_27513/m.40650 type:complete len:144 (+) Transcript_27513:1386-1817(+)